MLLIGLACFVIVSRRGYHSPQQIEDHAREFVEQEAARTGVEWMPGAVNLKTFVPRCAVPLNAAFATKFWFAPSGDGQLKKQQFQVVRVTCFQTWYFATEMRRWDVDVRVAQRPKSR